MTKFLRIGLLLFYIPLAMTTTAQDKYVAAAPLGNDTTGNGTQAAPYRTYLKAQGNSTDGGRVLLRGGDVFYTDNVYQDRQLIITSWGTGKPVISGWYQLSGAWTQVAPNIWQSTADNSLPSNLSQLKLDGVWRPIGRLPRNGFYTITSHSAILQSVAYDDSIRMGYSPVTYKPVFHNEYQWDSAGQESGLRITEQAGAGWGKVNAKTLAATPDMDGAEVVIRSTRWSMDRYLVTIHSDTSVTYAPISSQASVYSYEPINGYGFFFQNHQACLQQDGDWAYNSSTKQVLLYSTTNPATRKVEVSKPTQAFNSGTAGTVYSNLIVEGYNAKGIYGTAANLQFLNTTFRYCGEDGIYAVDQDGYTIDGASFGPLQNNGITADKGGTGSRNWKITNTTADSISMINGMGKSNDAGYAFKIIGSGLRFKYNQMNHLGYTGIYFRDADVQVDSNSANGYCLAKDDGGAYYTFEGGAQITNASQRYIRHNVAINGVGQPAGADAAEEPNKAFGIYIDQHASEVTMDGNFIDSSAGGVFVHNGHNLTITGNTFFENDYGIRLRTYAPQNPVSGLAISGNTILAKAGGKILYVDTDHNLLNFGAIGSNAYYMPDTAGTYFKTRISGLNPVDRTFAGWKTTYGSDASTVNGYTTALAVSNGTNANAVKATGGIFRTYTGTLVPGSIKLGPWSGTFMFPSTAQVKFLTKNGIFQTFLGTYQVKQ